MLSMYSTTELHLQPWYYKLPFDKESHLLYSEKSPNRNIKYKSCQELELWHIPVIAATWEVEAKGSQVPGQPGQLCETLSHNKIFKSLGYNSVVDCFFSKRPQVQYSILQEKKEKRKKKRESSFSLQDTLFSPLLVPNVAWNEVWYLAKWLFYYIFSRRRSPYSHLSMFISFLFPV